MTHANAPLTPVGRLRLAQVVVNDGWPVRRAAERFQVSPATAAKWARRYRDGEAMVDRPSRPRHSPAQCSQRLERRIVKLRYCRRWGPHRISYHLGVPRSTVGRVLARYRMPLLAHIDQVTGLPIRKPKAVRYEADAPGDLVHVDIKKLGKIPDGGGWRMFGRDSEQHRSNNVVQQRAKRAGAPSSRGYVYLHHAVDDHSRLAYSEQLPNERKETAAAFWERARGFFAEAGIDVKSVMTDNGACYRSRDFAKALDGIKHRRTRPYRPQTNGKVERFNRTLASEWAYAQVFLSDAARSATYADWLHFYNHHRPHTAIGGLTPSDRVHNLTGNYT